jgi:hypothetical protein
LLLPISKSQGHYENEISEQILMRGRMKMFDGATWKKSEVSLKKDKFIIIESDDKNMLSRALVRKRSNSRKSVIINLADILLKSFESRDNAWLEGLPEFKDMELMRVFYVLNENGTSWYLYAKSIADRGKWMVAIDLLKESNYCSYALVEGEKVNI